MELALRRRLLGAMVLISLGVIFLPMVLSGRGGIHAPQRAAMPTQPAWPELASLVLPIDLYSAAVVQEARTVKGPPDAGKPPKAPTHSQAKLTPSVKPSAPAQGQLSSWVTQLGSFGQEKNALALRDRLRAHKYPAFIERVTLNKKVLYRVRVGPELNKKRALTIRDQVSREFKLKGQLLAYP